jgi:1,2-diacylglycerol 3-beta-galactosyltransferase
MTRRPHILFLFSDTGGGHRSAAEAIIEALQLEYDGRITTEMVDIIKDYAPPPFNQLPAWYPYMVRTPELWGLGYRLSNGPRRVDFIISSTWPYVRQSIKKLIAKNPTDLIVSVHPLANTPVLRALGKNRPRHFTVVTDMVTTHAFWYDRRTDMCLVATEGAYQRALGFNLKPEQLRIVGLPVADRFCKPPGDKEVLRRQFGWPQDRPVVLLVGGGEGMGPVEKTATAIAAAKLPLALVIIAGRNQKLKERLESKNWPIPTFVYGFVSNMPDFMAAASVLVTKAGPGTVSEALNAGLPMILYSRLPGQEDGNIAYVTEMGAGVWAPTPEQITTILREWVTIPERLAEISATCRHVARPQAARTIAHILADNLGIGKL